MSESKRSPEKISRREFNKLAGAALAGVGLAGAGFAGWKLLEGLGLRVGEDAPSRDSFEQELADLSRPTREASTPTPFQPQSATEIPHTTPEPSPTPELINKYKFAKADFSDSAHQIDMLLTLNNGEKLLIPLFTPLPWREGILDGPDFKPKSNTGVTYLDESGRKILNLHSGREGPLDTAGYTMWKVQLAIETNARGYRIYPREVDEKLSTNFTGGDAIVRQTDSGPAKMVAAVRVPPKMVLGVSQHLNEVRDAAGQITTTGLIAWIAETFPDSGFQKILSDPNILIIKTCGRRLRGETQNAQFINTQGKIEEETSEYRQSRFFLAFKES